MVDLFNKNSYIVLLGLVIILIILLIVRRTLINKLSKESLEIQTSSTIGKEEIQENYLEVVKAVHGTLAVLGDGLGKNEAGRISSIISVRTIVKHFLKLETIDKLEYFFRKAFNDANREILKRVDNNEGGSSVAATIIIDNLLYYALVGNINICIFRNGELFKLTEGHTINVLAKNKFYEGKISKESALQVIKEKKLLYYLGQEGFRDMEIFETPIKLHKGDIVVLMNKGIYESLTWTQLENIICGNRKELSLISNKIIQGINRKKNQYCNNGSIILMKYV